MLQHWRTTNYPTLEITTNIAAKGCVVDCAFCPQRTLEKSYQSDVRVLSLDDYKRLVDKVPKEVRITFAGFTEPFLNKHCTDMVLYAHEQGHTVSVFTTGVGMKPDDVYRLAHVPYAGNPNGGFCLHLPDNEGIANHPVNYNYIRVVEAFHDLQRQIKNFYVMCMSENVHESVSHYFPRASVPQFWNRAGNLTKELHTKPPEVQRRTLHAAVKDKPQTCGCVEGLYHNVLLPNGDVSLCCMDYSLENILGNLYEQSFDDVVPKYKSCFDICRRCENGIDP